MMRTIAIVAVLAVAACDSPIGPEWPVDVADFALVAPSGPVASVSPMDLRDLVVGVRDSNGRSVALPSIPENAVRHSWRGDEPWGTGWATTTPLPLGTRTMTLHVWIAGAGPETVGVRVVDVPVVMLP